MQTIEAMSQAYYPARHLTTTLRQPHENVFLYVRLNKGLFPHPSDTDLNPTRKQRHPTSGFKMLWAWKHMSQINQYPHAARNPSLPTSPSHWSETNLVRFPTEHPLFRKTVHAFWLLSRTESPRDCQTARSFLHGLSQKVGILVGERFRARARRQKLAHQARG